MIKRLFVAVAALLVLAVPALAFGTIPFSLSQQLDQYGKPLAGCQFYTIQAGTTSTPQNAFQDSALTIPLPNPQTCDSAGRLPQMFLADGQIKVRLADKNGVTQIVADGIQVVGASSGGGGGGGTVDPTTVLQTGDIKATYGTGPISGFVRTNGRTIGSATSGATERANSDCQALFLYLWNTDPTLVVVSGRGASAAADWTANKQITLPDWRGRALAGLDDMGNSAAGRLTSSYFGSATSLGSAGGAESETLTAAQLPANIPNTVSVTINPFNALASTGSNGFSNGANSALVPNAGNISATATAVINPGGGSPHSIASPMMLTTIYIKL